MKAKQGAANNSTEHQDVGWSGRHVIYDLSIRKRKDNEADRHLAEKIMHNKQYNISGRADDENDFEDGPSRKSRKKRGANDNEGAERVLRDVSLLNKSTACFALRSQTDQGTLFWQ